MNVAPDQTIILGLQIFTDFYILCCSLITSLSVGSQCSVLLIQPQSSDCPRKAKGTDNCTFFFDNFGFFIFVCCLLTILCLCFILLLLTYYSHHRLIAQEFDSFDSLDDSWNNHHTLIAQEKQNELYGNALALSRKMATLHDNVLPRLKKQNAQENIITATIF